MILPLSIPSPTFQYFQIGPLTIHLYALWIILGIVLAAMWTSRRLSRRGGENGVVFDFVVWSVLLGIIGARLYHVVTHWGDYFVPGKQWWNPFEDNAIWNIWDGGIAIFGALLGGAIGVLIASRLTGVRFLSFADALVPGLMLAQAFGRLGNYFNHELFGGPTTLPWGLEIESSNPAFPVGLPAGTLFHPTFLYEIVWSLVGIVVLLALEKKFKLRWGRVFALYLVWYGIGRAIIESMRVDPSLLFLGLRTNVLAALLAVVLGILIYIIQTKRHVGREVSVYLPGRRNPADSVLADTADAEVYHHVITRDTAE
ncbi:MAG: prolipoprotein diacylglyceryl transferase [Leucobacter sp.]